MNHYYMDLDPYLIGQRNNQIREEVRSVRLEEDLRENKGDQERKEKRTMVRSAVSKVMLVGRATVFMVGLSVMLALVLGTATTALGATGATFILGKVNVATTPTSLVSTLTDATASALSITNKSGGSALRLGVLSGKAPIEVSATAGTATNLSADKLDGKDSSEFLGKSEKAADAAHADSAETAADANTLDGKDSAEFLSADGKAHDASHADNADHATTADSAANAISAGDANTLDGKNSTDFVSGTGTMTTVDEGFSDPDGTGGGKGLSSVLSVPGAQIQAACVAQSGGAQMFVNRTSEVSSVSLWRNDGGADPTAKTLRDNPYDWTADKDSSVVSAADHVILQGSSSAGTFTAVLFTGFEGGNTCHWSGYVLSAQKEPAPGGGGSGDDGSTGGGTGDGGGFETPGGA